MNPLTPQWLVFVSLLLLVLVDFGDALRRVRRLVEWF